MQKQLAESAPRKPKAQNIINMMITLPHKCLNCMIVYGKENKEWKTSLHLVIIGLSFR